MNLDWEQGWGQLFEMHVVAVVRSCEASICSCNRSCSYGCLKPMQFYSQLCLAMTHHLQLCLTETHHLQLHLQLLA